MLVRITRNSLHIQLYTSVYKIYPMVEGEDLIQYSLNVVVIQCVRK